VLPRYGDEPLADIKRVDWQELVDEWLAEGLAPSTVAVTVSAIAALYSFEVSRGRLKENATAGLNLPRPDNGRTRFASPQEAAKLLAAVPDNDRVIWATAFYAGLRVGELQALAAEEVMLEDGVLDVQFGWDRVEGRQPTKGRNRRKVPIASAVRELLVAELLRTGRRGSALVFGCTDTTPFDPRELQRRADRAWKGLERITPHECRHTYASLMIAAGVNTKALSSYMGHASIQITMDRYGHLMPGNEEEAAGLLDAYLARSQTA
jgi:integrase